MMRIIICFLVITLISISSMLNAQDLKFGQRVMINTSLTYIFNTDGNAQITSFYRELTWKKNIAINLNKSIYWGISHHNIYSFGSSFIPNTGYREQTYLVGTFVQYDFLPRYKERVYIETSWNYGNYCTCGTLKQDPYKVDGLTYFGIGAGVTFPIKKRFSLDLAMIGYYITSDEIGKYAYNPYIIGLSWDIINDKAKANDMKRFF